MKKIYIFIPSFVGGGAEIVAINLYNKLKEYNYIIRVITFSDTGELVDLVSRDDIFLIKQTNNKITNLFYRILYLRKFMFSSDDVVISFLDSCNLSLMLSCIKAKKILTFHSLIERPFVSSNLFTKLFYKLRTYIYRKADELICVSTGVKAELDNYLGCNDSKVIYNYLKPVNYKKKYSDNIRLSFIGRLNKVKNIDFIINTLLFLPKEYILNIYGEGELKSELETLTKENGLCDRVKFLGFKNKSYIYENTDIICLASEYESFSNVILEGAVSGKMIVSLDCDYGPREIFSYSKRIENEDNDYSIYEIGALVHNNSIESYANAIKETSKITPTLYFSEVEDFKEEKILEKWFQLL
ncbi:TPA: glycosyltransferase [Photobacterium damselae]